MLFNKKNLKKCQFFKALLKHIVVFEVCRNVKKTEEVCTVHLATRSLVMKSLHEDLKISEKPEAHKVFESFPTLSLI